MGVTKGQMKVKPTLKEYITKQGSIASFAKKTGFSRQYVSHVLNGRRKPSSAFISKVLNLTKMPFEYFFEPCDVGCNASHKSVTR